jgi:PAS domain S-box-containing protein
MEETTDEIQRLQACINDLISVLAIPAVWSGREPAQIAGTLLDVLLRVLRLDFAYARLKHSLGGAPIEVARFAEYRDLTPLLQGIGQALNPWLENDPKKWPLLVRNPIGEGDVSIVPLRLGLQDRIGIIVAGSQRADFPAETDRLLLRIAANQATIALQEARAHDELERLVAERAGELVRANESLHRSETYLTEAQRLSHTGSWAWNVSTGEVLWSRESYRVFGLAPEQTSLNVDLIKKLRHSEDRALAEQTLEGALRERRDFEFESRIVLPDGSIRHVRSVGRPVINDAGVLVEFVGAVMDVTEGKTREEALRKSQADLAHVTRVATLGEMSASIAHEVNQPLAAAVTSASACLRWLDAQKLEEARWSASRVIAEVHRASEIIGRIRALTNKAPPQKDWLDVNETIHEVIELARSEIQRNNIVLEIQLSEQVPVILADRIQLQQVILNLVMNAVEAMNGVSIGPRELLIRSGTDESEQVMISVRDSGPGIDPESLEHLFEAFYTTKPHGLGMGLAISRSIIDAHGGRLWATANTPRGAVFQFTLPNRWRESA